MAVVVVELLHLEALRHQDRQVVLTPTACWQVLQEQQRILEGHAFELLRKLKEQGGNYVAVELGEPFLLGKIGIPEPYDLEHCEFTG